MEGQDKIRVKVEIYGRSYKLMAGPGTPVEYLHKVASLVDEQMHKVSKHQPSLDIPRVAVLAAVNIADRLCRTQTELSSETKQQTAELAEQNEKLKKQWAEQAERNTALQQENDELKKRTTELQTQNTEHEQSIAELRSELNEARTKLANLRNEKPDANELVNKYAKLQEEYEKLQSEFNDWLQLVEKESERH